MTVIRYFEFFNNFINIVFEYAGRFFSIKIRWLLRIEC
jgi:hypothetical protein